jgi:hypothetical protein
MSYLLYSSIELLCTQGNRRKHSLNTSNSASANIFSEFIMTLKACCISVKDESGKMWVLCSCLPDVQHPT